MNVPFERETKEQATRRYWEKRHGLKIGQQVTFNVKIVESLTGKGGTKK